MFDLIKLKYRGVKKNNLKLKMEIVNQILLNNICDEYLTYGISISHEFLMLCNIFI